MFPGCDSDEADKQKVIYPTPVTAPFKDTNRFKIYVKFAEQERSRSTAHLADQNVRDVQKIWGTRFGINYQFK